MSFKKSDFRSALSYDQKIITGYKYQIAKQAKVLRSIQRALPDEISPHILYCTISGKKISLYADSPVWTSQLRFYKQAILKAATDSKQGSFDTFQAKIIPKVREVVIEKKTVTPSEESIDLLLSQAEHQTNDELKSALLNLGSTLKKRRKNKDDNQTAHPISLLRSHLIK